MEEHSSKDYLKQYGHLYIKPSKKMSAIVTPNLHPDIGGSRFVNLMDKFLFTENGDIAVSEAGLGSTLLALFDKAMRDANELDMRRMVDQIFREGSREDKINMCCLAFQTRDPRQGKGERSLGLTLFLALPAALQNALAVCLPEHGSWKDIRSLMIRDKDISTDLLNVLVKLYGSALIKDLQCVETPSSPLSLCAKYALRERVPLEKNILKQVFKEFKELGGDDAPFKNYRQKISYLRKKLEVSETLMSANQWDKIDPKKVPSECIRRHKKAFLNETNRGKERYPLSIRKECRKKFMQAAEKKDVKSAVVDLPALVREVIGQSPLKNKKIMSDSERIMLDAQAAAHVEHLKGTMKGNLGSILPVVDTSGSMVGTPMNVAIGLGLFAAYVAHPLFANRMITFSERPEWIVVDPSEGWTANVCTVSRAPWGLSTNLVAVINMIMSCLQLATPPLQPEEIPRVIIFSDMQFDYCGETLWATHCDVIKAKFRDMGRLLVGRDYDLRITYWNLRADTKSYPTTCNTLGISMLSGYSTNLLKSIMQGDFNKSPLDVLLDILHDKKFEDVRQIASNILKN